MSGRLKIVAAVLFAVLTVGVVGAYGALGAQDTATGTLALSSESGGNFNTADGFYAMLNNSTGHDNVAVGLESLEANMNGSDNAAIGDSALLDNTTGSNNTALGLGAGAGAFPNMVGSNNSFLGYNAGPGTNTEIDNATALGANSTVSESDAVSLGDATANVGIGNAAPQSRLQIGSGGTSTFGDYLQIPVVNSTAKTPPANDCEVDVGIGRLVLQQNKKKGTLWACLSPGVWVKV